MPDSTAANRLSTTPLSLLDLAPILQGGSATDTFHNSLALAQTAERLGYTRYWLAEHHNMASIASSATAVLIGYIAGGTASIRVGSGGIMLPNHAPLVVAEQFGTLASLYPGRIDLGLGRAPGTDPTTAMALRRSRMETAADFPDDIRELQTYFSAENRAGRVRAIPGEGLDIPIWVLGSSTDSAHLAALYGLPYAFAAHFAPAQLMDALRIYKQRFRPSQYLSAPYAMACVNVIAADTDAEAARLATSFYQLALGIITGQRRPLPPPVDSMDGLWSAPEEAAVKNMMTHAYIGNGATVRDRLNAFLELTGVDELMAVAHIFDPAARQHSYEVLMGAKAADSAG